MMGQIDTNPDHQTQMIGNRAAFKQLPRHFGPIKQEVIRPFELQSITERMQRHQCFINRDPCNKTKLRAVTNSARINQCQTSIEIA